MKNSGFVCSNFRIPLPSFALAYGDALSISCYQVWNASNQRNATVAASAWNKCLPGRMQIN